MDRRAETRAGLARESAGLAVLAGAVVAGARVPVALAQHDAWGTAALRAGSAAAARLDGIDIATLQPAQSSAETAMIDGLVRLVGLSSTTVMAAPIVWHALTAVVLVALVVHLAGRLAGWATLLALAAAPFALAWASIDGATSLPPVAFLAVCATAATLVGLRTRSTASVFALGAISGASIAFPPEALACCMGLVVLRAAFAHERPGAYLVALSLGIVLAASATLWLNAVSTWTLPTPNLLGVVTFAFLVFVAATGLRRWAAFAPLVVVPGAVASFPSDIVPQLAGLSALIAIALVAAAVAGAAAEPSGTRRRIAVGGFVVALAMGLTSTTLAVRASQASGVAYRGECYERTLVDIVPSLASGASVTDVATLIARIDRGDARFRSLRYALPFATLDDDLDSLSREARLLHVTERGRRAVDVDVDIEVLLGGFTALDARAWAHGLGLATPTLREARAERRLPEPLRLAVLEGHGMRRGMSWCRSAEFDLECDALTACERKALARGFGWGYRQRLLAPPCSGVLHDIDTIVSSLDDATRCALAEALRGNVLPLEAYAMERALAVRVPTAGDVEHTARRQLMPGGDPALSSAVSGP